MYRYEHVFVNRIVTVPAEKNNLCPAVEPRYPEVEDDVECMAKGLNGTNTLREQVHDCEPTMARCEEVQSETQQLLMCKNHEIIGMETEGCILQDACRESNVSNHIAEVHDPIEGDFEDEEIRGNLHAQPRESADGMVDTRLSDTVSDLRFGNSQTPSETKPCGSSFNHSDEVNTLHQTALCCDSCRVLKSLWGNTVDCKKLCISSYSYCFAI